jgi:hypothetical protein
MGKLGAPPRRRLWAPTPVVGWPAAERTRLAMSANCCVDSVAAKYRIGVEGEVAKLALAGVVVAEGPVVQHSHHDVGGGGAEAALARVGRRSSSAGTAGGRGLPRRGEGTVHKDGRDLVPEDRGRTSAPVRFGTGKEVAQRRDAGVCADRLCAS